MTSGDNSPILSHVEPILPVSDIFETVDYWCDVLGFTNKWTWGNPIDYGGVYWQGVFIQFLLHPTRAAQSKGNSIFIRVKNIEASYQFHQNKKAEIIEELENKPWGLAAYRIRENNGYYIIFSGSPISKKEKSESTDPAAVNIIPRMPTVKEYRRLLEAVGWAKNNDVVLTEKILAAPVFGLVAEDPVTKEAIGCGLVLGDGAGFYYVKDLMVNPRWQKKQVGTMLMNKLMNWIDNDAPGSGNVYLYTRDELGAFYKQFDFTPVFGMVRPINKKKS